MRPTRGLAAISAAISGVVNRCCNCDAPAAASGARRISQARPRGRRRPGGCGEGCDGRGRRGRRVAGRGVAGRGRGRSRPASIRAARRRKRVPSRRSRAQTRITDNPPSNPLRARTATTRQSRSMMAAKRASRVVGSAVTNGMGTWTGQAGQAGYRGRREVMTGERGCRHLAPVHCETAEPTKRSGPPVRLHRRVGLLPPCFAQGHNDGSGPARAWRCRRPSVHGTALRHWREGHRGGARDHVSSVLPTIAI
jgi:hypothetical protein